MSRSGLLVAVLAALLCSPASALAAGAPQYPDLRTLPPRDLMLDRTDVSATGTAGDMHNVLRFSNTVVNEGQGPLMMKGTFDTDPNQAPAIQHIYDGSGNDVEQHEVGVYTWHEAHQHFHFVDWGRYELWTKASYDAWVAAGRPDTMAPDVAGSKTTSCVEDEEFINSLPGTPYPGVYPASACGHNPDGTMTQGLSVGWGDTYDFYRQEQWMDLGQSTLADGDYVLRSVADPFNHIYESAGKADATRESETANEAITPFRISGGQIVDGARPSGTVFVNGVDPTTASSQVDVRLIGRDDVSGVDQVRVSNDGTNWKTYDYGGDGSIPMRLTWDLTDARYGGSAATGTRTVYAQFHDRSGKWSPTETDTIDYTGGSSAPPPPPASSVYADAVRADAPVSWWRLGETTGPVARDQMGLNDADYGLAATLGAPGLLSADGDPAVHVDGNAQVSARTTTNMAPGPSFSLEAWIRPDALPAAGSFASIATRTDAYSLQLNGPQLEWTVIQGGTRKRLKAPVGAIEVGHTYHVVGSYDGTTQRLYIDGMQVGSAALSGPADTGSGLHIGSWDGGSEFFKGSIDEVAFYAKALPGLEVKRHHDAGIATVAGVATPSNLTAHASAGDRVDLGWADNASNETGYVVERATSSDFAGAQRITLPADATTYADTGRTAGATYWYRVQAVSASDASAWSNAASATTPAPPPPTSTTPTTTTPTSTTPTPTTPPTTTPTSPPPAPPPAYDSTVLADAPLSYWRLDETSGTTARDVRGVHNGSYRNAPRLGVDPLIARDDGHALQLDGSNDHVTIPSASDLALGSRFTLEAWVRPAWLPLSGSFASVVSKAEAYSLQFNGGRMEFTLIQSGSRKRLQAPAGTVQPGGTYHVVGTYDGATQRLYVNGVEVAHRAQTGAASTSSYNVRIGSWDGSGEFLGGVVDEVAVYRSTLSAERVQAHYAAGAASATTRAFSRTRAMPRRRTRARQAHTRRTEAARLRARRRP